MSIDYYVYVGPVARCTVEYVSARRRGCVNKACRRVGKQAGDGDFCPSCGHEFDSFDVPNTKEKVDHWSLFGDNDVLNSELSGDSKYRVFMPNVRRPNQPREFQFDVDDSVLVDDVNVVAEVAWFRTAFSREIEQLHAAYGSVAIKWVIFSFSR